MDPVFHTLTGVFISKIATETANPLIIGAALLPDLVGTLAFEVEALKRSKKTSIKEFGKDFIKYNKQTSPFGRSDYISYQSTHSLIGWAGASLLFFLILPKIWLPMTFSYLAHIIIDIPTHEKGFAVRILFPFHDKVFFEGKQWTNSRKVFISMWLLLILVFIIF